MVKWGNSPLQLRESYLPIGDHYKSPCHSLGVEFQETADGGDLPGSAVILQAQEYDSGMNLTVAVDLLSEVFIVRNQDSVLRNGTGDHGIVINAAGILVAGEDIVPLVSEPAGHGRPGTFVHEEAHL